ncbi:MAG: PKD domain-containing protein [Desulfosarcina sp.]|nr:PKD domain-containing protein [Desulfosarcina sp.]MBC2741624.1 PKD domain-containing protein [Desulfosarcina sp.]MBC2764538.1 PKD domain-containing protein [Desulfosarcina sp.]
MRAQDTIIKIRSQKAGRIFLTTIFFVLSLFFLLPSWALAAPPQVICVPQVPSDLLVPHDTWSGEPTTLKGVAKDSDGDLVGGTYYWEYGDGDESAPQAITNPDNLAATHTYTDDPGTLFVARLHVTDAGGESSSDDYRLILREESLDVEINKAIDDGLWWLYTHRETTGAYTIIPNPVLVTPTGDPGLLGEYFNNTSLSGDPVLTRIDPEINFYWGGSPGTGINNDYFSVRWTGTLHIPADGYYSFASHNDDGTRLYVDGNLLINDWTGHAPAWRYSSAVYLTAGEHSFQVDFYEGYGGAQAKIYWSPTVLYRWNNVKYGNHYANSTASAVQAYEINGHLETGDPDEDPYVNVVRGGMDYLMTTLITQNMSAQAGGHPEDYDNDGDGTNDGGNGIGLSVNSGRAIYELGAVMDALVASGTPDAMARTGGANVLGRTYQDIVQDMVDMYAWGMDDSGGDRGGWRYSWNSDADNSASQWGAIGMVAAERHFGCIVPDWVKTWNNYWLNASYSGIGFGYTGGGNGWATTPSGMVQLSFDDYDVTDKRWQTAEAYLANNWSGFISIGRNNRYYSYYAFAKAMRLALPEEVTHLSATGLDWYGDDTVGLARVLVARQNADGSWPYDGWPYVGERTAAAWNVIILTRTLFEKPPVAIIHAQPNPGAVGQTIHFDASGSYHVDPAKEIADYLWDFDASDGVDFVHPDATGLMVDHAYGDLGDYTASLKVIDNSTPSRFDIGTYTIRITIPPHPPTAVIGGPYLATVGEAVQVDGSGSYDIDENLGDSIVTWEWEADFAAPYDFNEATGQIATLPAFSAAGRQDIALRVTDNTAIAFPTAGTPDLSDVAYGEVIVYEAGVTDLYARPKATKCQLVWTHIDAPLYDVLRSETGPNQGFELIGTTDSTYSTFLDYNVVMYKDYWYRIRSEIGSETMLSAPVHIYSIGRIRNRPPVITSEPLLSAQEQLSYAYDVQADDPEGTSLSYLLDLAPVGMVINAATGLISWTPTRDQVGLNDVMVRVNDARRASASQFFQVVVDPRPNTAPIPDPDGPYSGLVNEALTFSGSAVDLEGDPIVEYRWVFGDGFEAYGQVVPHTYTAEGAYVVTLYATDDRGATGHAETRCQTGLANRSPIADAGGPYEGEVNHPVTVDGSLSDDPDGDSLTYTWNFDTATGPQTGEQTSFTFDAVGTYEVTLTVEDGNGGSDTTTAEIVVTPPNESPVSVFTNDPFLWNNLTFDGTGSYDPEGRPLTSWEWNFGDGVITTGAMVSHLYATAGDYTVRLTVTDDKGATGIFEQVVAITHPTPNNEPDIEAGGPYTGPLDTAMTLTATGADPDGDPITFTWTYDGQDTVGETLQLTFATAGTYDVLLTAEDGFGGSATDTAQVIIFDPSASGGDETPPDTVITTPLSGSLLSGMVTFKGSVTDDNLVLWVLEYAPTDTEEWQTIATGSSNVDNNFLGQLDAGLLQGDLYRFRLRAQDQNYSVNSWIQCEVSSPLKLGQFSLEYVDLAMPLAGIPIKVIRRYDTRDADDLGDFGYGWKLGATDPEIRETIPVHPLEETLGFFVAEPYRMETRIYLTDPDGKRIGFTFEPTPSATLLGTVYIPKFTPDPGVHDRLEADPIALTLRGDGTYIFFLLGFNYNPSDFRLVRKDGTTYHYNQFSGLQKISDRNDNELVYTYDGIFHSSGESVQFNRDAEGRIVEVVDPDTNIISYVYDAAGDLEAVTDQENLTSSYTYYSNPAHYLNTITDSLGRQAARYEYDADGRQTAFTNALGDRFEKAYDPAAFSGTFTDANGNVTELFYDAQGNLIREAGPLGGETAFTYDADNNETSVTDENGNITLFTYDDRGNILTETDALGNVTTFTYDAFNKVTSATDSLGLTTTAVYDSQGNMTQFTNPAGQIATLSYDVYGRIDGLTDFHGNLTVYEYSAGIAPPTRIINPDGTHKDYVYLWNGQIVSITDEAGGVQSNTYDQDGRLVMETDALGNTTVYGYDGHLITSKTCPLGNVTTYEYDDANRIISQTDHLGGVTTFTYDANGNRLSITDPVGNTTRFVYDALNRLVTKIDPLNMRTTYTYDPADNLVERVDRNNRRLTFAYNALNQRVREAWFDGVSTVNIIDFGLDAVGNQRYVADHHSSLFFSYDAVNNLLTADNTGTPGVPAVELIYSYDPMGNRISVEDNLGVRADSAYNSRNRLISRTWQGTGMADPVRVDCAYNALGTCDVMDRFTDIAGTNQVGSSSFSYDGLGRLTELTHDTINGGVSTVADYDYTYNAAGLLLSEVHHGQMYNYSYDAAGQLTGSIRSVFGNENFSYDDNGNRNGTGYVVGASNRIMGDIEYDYDYDAEGNLIIKTETATGMVTTFTYDHRNRLTAIEKRSAGGVLLSEISYTYDGLDRRIRTTVNGQTVYTVYDGKNVWADFDSFANLETRYMFGDEIDALFARSRPTGETNWYLADKLGTIRDLVDGDGTLLNHVDYDSFGGVRAQTDAGHGDRFLFTGREYESETGLYYYRGRYYDHWLGRFISEDPTGFEGGDFNLYRYVNNSPLNGTDPTGECAMKEYAELMCTALSSASFGSAVSDQILELFGAVNDVLAYGRGRFTIEPLAPIVGLAIPCGLPTPFSTPKISGGN